MRYRALIPYDINQGQIGQRVGQTKNRDAEYWREVMTGPSTCPPRCTTVHDEMQDCAHGGGDDRSATSRTLPKQIQFVTHHSESAGTIHLRFRRGNARKVYIASLTFDWKPLVFAPPMIDMIHWPACSSDLSPIENVWSMLAQRLARGIPYQLWQYVEATWTAVPQGCIQNIDSTEARDGNGFANNLQLH
ncbi:hypothetical protein TNCV_2010941 [Trichonephila clavipes]|nr:hypothetical protein TNCV_2010941 [Trichonephila clavipes]